ncbi:class I SAM-dependent methyltransferase [Mangrovimonas xylaniphaga]|uniref:class I SAM-dependent methyltransferase n=1 Tax=Mangrovimonas xylaniphaga TaxID=1645915 RepID=UPI0006B59A8C|nr:class I SAM-dependent methyltransferase [Mangrovimonas xylaniphaga]
MTFYEFKRWVTYPLMTTHLVTVRQDLKRLLKGGGHPSLLDVGGRKSPYTINLPAAITLLDVPQEAGTKAELNLGFTRSILDTIKSQRSNIKNVVIQDMTQSTLAAHSYDAVVCVEVIEHVKEDEAFVNHISKVIKPGGWAYFTTPNGDYIKNEGPERNPDHVRHYTRVELQQLLGRYFETVDVHYAVKTGRYRVKGLRGYTLKKPLQTLDSIFSNVVNRFQSVGMASCAVETAHLVAVVHKNKNSSE